MFCAFIAQLAGTVTRIFGATDKPYKMVEELIGRGVTSRISAPIASRMPVNDEVKLVLFIFVNSRLCQTLGEKRSYENHSVGLLGFLRMW